MLRVVVLGAAAGGGVPQWNCGCPVCRKARSENPELQSTQASIAISADGEHWFLINASPDLRQQLIATPQLHPKAGQLRHSPICGRDPDQRRNRCGRRPAVDARGLAVYDLCAPAGCLRSCESNSIFNVLSENNVRRQPIETGPGRSSRHCPTARRPASRFCHSPCPARARGIWKARRIPAATTVRAIRSGFGSPTRLRGKYFYFLAACADVTDDLKSRLAGAPLIFFDGTVWRDDELIAAGPRQQDRTRHGTYCNVRRQRRDREPCRPRYRPEGVSAYQQLQPGAAARLRRAQGMPSARAGKSPPMERRSRCERDEPERDDRLFARPAARRSTAPRNSKRRSATSARRAITICIRFTGCCTAAS